MIVSLVAGAVLVAPSAASADTAELSRRPLGSPSYILVFKITNDTAAPMTSWRMEFDLPAGEQVQGLFAFSIRVSRVGQHFILENANPVLVAPGHSFTASIVILGDSWPLNCVTRGTPCHIDTEAPSTPPNVRIVRTTYPSSGALLQWGMSTDNVWLTGYEITRNGAVIATTSSLSYTLPGTTPSGTVFGVRAFDDLGNRSALATAVYP